MKIKEFPLGDLNSFIRDTWDGCYFGQTLDISMTTAGSRPISFEFRVNQRDSRSI